MTAARRAVVAMAFAGIVACGKDKDTAKKPCERGAKVEVRVVDNDAPFMKALYARVGSNLEGQASDPAAIEAGVRADIEQWQTDTVTADGLPIDRKAETDYYLLAPAPNVLERYLATTGQQVPDDREIRIERVPADPARRYGEPREYWRTYYVLKEPMLDTRDIVDVQLGFNETTKEPMLLVVLTSEGKARFAKGTKAAIGKKVATLIDGIIMTAPIINGAITGGRFSLNVGTQAEADALARKLACVK